MNTRERLIVTIFISQLWLTPAILALLLIVIAQSDFLSFHTMAQRFAVMISFVMFAFVWATRDYRKNQFLLFLACGYFWIGTLDLVHVLVYERMGFFIEANENLSVQTWISARYSEALLLLAAPFTATRQRNGHLLLTAFGIVAVGLVTLIFSGQFPTAFIEGQGLTDFRVYSDYLIILILAFALFFLIRHPSNILKDEKVLISAAIIFTMCAELFFSFHVSFDDRSSLVGHILKTFAYWFIFQAIVINNLRKPFSDLHALQDYTRSLFEDSVTGMTLCRADGTFVDVNPAFARLTGYTVDELKSGMSYWTLTPEHHLEQEKSVVENLSHTGKLDPYEKEHIRKDGSLVPVRISGKRVVHDGETFNLSTVEDISEYVKGKKTSAELEFQKKALDEHAIVSITDVKGNITYANDKFCEISGYPREELLGQNHRLLKSEEHSDEFFKNLWRTIANGKPWHGEIKNSRKDGGYYWVEASIVPFLNEQGKPDKYVGIRTDITARKDAERAKAEFVSTASHELRTPLTSIKGALGLIKSGTLDDNSDKLRSMVNIAYNNSERLVLLINDILDMEKLEAGKMRFRMEPTDIAALLEEAVAANTGYGDEYGVTFTCFGTDTPAFVNVDKNRLMQVMANLLSNATKFSPRDGVVEVSLTRRDGDIRISVKDYGSGIPEEAQETIFEKFTQADSSDQRQKGGTGLGLSIVRMIVEEHDGHVGFTSTVDEGTTFYVDLPEMEAKSVQLPLETEE